MHISFIHIDRDDMDNINDYCSEGVWNPDDYSDWNGGSGNRIVLRLLNGHQQYDMSDFVSAIADIERRSHCTVEFVEG